MVQMELPTSSCTKFPIFSRSCRFKTALRRPFLDFEIFTKLLVTPKLHEAYFKTMGNLEVNLVNPELCRLADGFKQDPFRETPGTAH